MKRAGHKGRGTAQDPPTDTCSSQRDLETTEERKREREKRRRTGVLFGEEAGRGSVQQSHEQPVVEALRSASEVVLQEGEGLVARDEGARGTERTSDSTRPPPPFLNITPSVFPFLSLLD